MADVAQLVRALDCGSGGRGFKSHHSPQTKIPVFGRYFCLDQWGLEHPAGRGSRTASCCLRFPCLAPSGGLARTRAEQNKSHHSPSETFALKIQTVTYENSGLQHSNVVIPIITYTHPHTTSRVDIVSMIHCADAAYFRDVQDFIDGRAAEGATVHYERMRLAPDEQVESLSPVLYRKVRLMRTIMKRMVEPWKNTGLALQWDVLEPDDESWQNHDITDVEQARRISLPVVEGLAIATRFLAILDERTSLEKQRAIYIRGLQFKSQPPAWQRILGKPFYDAYDRVTINYRTGVALAALDDHLSAQPGSEVVIPWGGAHLPGFDAGLVERGYKRVGVQVLTAIRVP